MGKITKVCAIVAVKGGVGKTMTSINVARRLTDKFNQKVGLIDADFDNSNFSQFTNVEAELKIIDGKEFQLYDWNGIQVFSMSLIAGRERSVSMTGDRYAQMLDDCLRRSDWDVDYLIIDLPGGSSDVFRSVMQLFGENVIGNIVVTQPSMIDALHRILYLHHYFQIPILGVIENMSYFKCPGCEEVYYPFGEGKTLEISKKFEANVIGEIPISNDIAEKMVEGEAILDVGYLQAIDDACKIIIDSEIVKTGLFQKIKDKVSEEFSGIVQKTLIKVLIAVNGTNISFRDVRRDSGLTERKIMKLMITDSKMEQEIASIDLKFLDDGLKVVKNAKKADFEIVCDFKTLARSILKKRKINGLVEPFDPMDAFLNGEMKAYGEGHSAKTIQVFREIFSNEELMNKLHDEGKTVKILERFI